MEAVGDSAGKSYRLASEDQRQMVVALYGGCLVLAVFAAIFLLNDARALASAGGAAAEVCLAILVLLLVNLLGPLAIRDGSRRVEVTSAGLRSYNIWGVYQAGRKDIAAIELRTRTYGRSITPVWTPLVRLADGTAFWLDPLAGGQQSSDPKPEQLAVLEAIRSQLGLETALVKSINDPFPVGESHFATASYAFAPESRLTKTLPVVLATKTVVFTVIIGLLVGAGRAHHHLLALLGAVAYLAADLTCTWPVLRHKTRPGETRRGARLPRGANGSS